MALRGSGRARGGSAIDDGEAKRGAEAEKWLPVRWEARQRSRVATTALPRRLGLHILGCRVLLLHQDDAPLFSSLPAPHERPEQKPPATAPHLPAFAAPRAHATRYAVQKDRSRERDNPRARSRPGSADGADLRERTTVAADDQEAPDDAAAGQILGSLLESGAHCDVGVGHTPRSGFLVDRERQLCATDDAR